MELLKNLVYEKIIDGKSWNLDAFFKEFKEQLHLEEEDGKESISAEIINRINKDQSEILKFVHNDPKSYLLNLKSCR